MDEAAAVERAVERANEAPGRLESADVAAVLRHGDRDAVHFVGRTVVERLDAGDGEPVGVDAAAAVLEGDGNGPAAGSERGADDGTVRRALAATFLADLATLAPTAVAAHAPTLGAALDDEPDVATAATRALAAVADADPGAVVPHCGALVARFDAMDARARFDAATAVSRVAAREPDAVADHLPALFDLAANEYESLQGVARPDEFSGAERELFERMQQEDWAVRRDHEGARRAAAEAIAAIARERPGALAPHRDRLVTVIETVAHDRAAGHLFEAAGALARTDAAFARRVVDPIAPGLTATDREARAAAAWALSSAGEAAPDAVADAVAPQVDAVAGLLDADDAGVRARAAGLLAAVAPTEPDALAPAIDALLSALDDEEPTVRWGAAVALGALDGEPGRERIARLAETDPDPDVRRAAAAALGTGD